MILTFFSFFFAGDGHSVLTTVTFQAFRRLTRQSANVPNGTTPIVHSQFIAIVHAH